MSLEHRDQKGDPQGWAPPPWPPRGSNEVQTHSSLNLSSLSFVDSTQSDLFAFWKIPSMLVWLPFRLWRDQGVLPGWGGTRPAPQASEEEPLTNSRTERSRGGCCSHDSLSHPLGVGREGKHAELIPGAPSDEESIYLGCSVSPLKAQWWWLFGKWMAVCCEQFFKCEGGIWVETNHPRKNHVESDSWLCALLLHWRWSVFYPVGRGL